jgi:hypothetical protein
MVKLGNIASFTNIDGTTVTGIIEKVNGKKVTIREHGVGNWVVTANMLTFLNIGGE